MVQEIHIDGNAKGDTPNLGKKSNEIADANLVVNSQKNPDKGGKTVATEKELPEKEAEDLAREISEDPETKNQIDQLKKLGEKYKNNELKDAQINQYETLMATIRTELDRDVPSVIEMNNEIDVNYYNKHPEEAERMANETVNNYKNMDDIHLVQSVLSRTDYLNNNSRQKLYKVISSVIQNLDEDAKSILKNEEAEE